MARVARGPSAGLRRDERGVVYVEFLLAFFPLLLLFFAVCQIALITSARLVVEHAAQSAVRSAIVMLDEPPSEFDNAPRGDLSQGRPPSGTVAEELLKALGLDSGQAESGFALPDVAAVAGAIAPFSGAGGAGQSGARMAPIRTAAYFPLLVLAPRPSTLSGTGAQSLGDALPKGFEARMRFGLAYSRAATVVTMHDAPGEEALAVEPIEPKAPITVRVTYFFQCGVPLVRALICDTLATLLAPAGGVVGAPPNKAAARLKLVESPGSLQALAGAGSRFVVLTAEATLPNQGAHYYEREEQSP